jgi:hypothetical protein
MNDFKICDEVRVIEKAIHGTVPVGTVDVITVVHPHGEVRVGNSSRNWFLGGNGGKLELVKRELVKPEPVYPNPPQMHQKEIIAWAKGAQIQWFGKINEKWYDNENTPPWRTDIEYRIKPDVPDVDPRLELLNEKKAELQKAMALINKEIGEL